MIAVFCTISIDTRLVMTTAPAHLDAIAAESAGELVQRIVPADILARRDDTFARN